MGSGLIGVAVVEDHPLYRQGLVQTIESSGELELIGSAPTVGDMEAMGYQGVDVVVLDLHLPDSEGAAAVSRVRANVEAVLVVSAAEDRQHVLDAIGAGAGGYLPKSTEASEIVKAISTIAAGGTYVSPVLAAYLLRESRSESSSTACTLTSREREILSLLSRGETDADIAEQLFISVRTVRSHLDRIRDKTGRRRRAELTRLAYEQETNTPD